jgi:GNAT superfamily N-acetyltransferase
MSVEQGAQIVFAGRAVCLRYPKPFQHPWPRTVELWAEIMASDLASAAKARSLVLAKARELHRLSIFGCDVHTDGEAIAAAGYDGCWNTSLLAAQLDEAPGAASASLAIERVERPEQIAELNALDPEFPSHPASLGRQEFVDLLGRHAGRAVAKGQLVCMGGERAYVADMFTGPAARKAGYAGAVLSALHNEAAARSVRRTVLIPSQTAAESRFYEKRGYRQACLRAVFLSKA